MNDQPALDTQPQSANGSAGTSSPASEARQGRGTKVNKRYLILLLGILFIFILAVISYIGSKQQEQPVPTPTPTPTPASPRVEDQIIIKFRPGLSEKFKSEVLRKYNATIIKRIDAIDRVVIQVPKGQEDAILDEMKKDKVIENAEPDYINQATYVPNDPSLNIQWGLENSGQVIKNQQGTPNADVNAEPAWDVTKGSGVKIAILDTGINMNHPDLSLKIVATKDFIGTGVEDQFGHGTHVAGIAAASTNNSAGVSGTCPDCQLIVGKVLNDQGSGPDSVILQGITWAADQGAKVISMSFSGTGNSTAKQDAINYAWNKGAVLVAAAGNNGNTNRNYPAANNNIVSVAATDNKDQKASFSTYGTWVDVAAPGKSIYSTLPTHTYNMQTKSPSLQLNYDYLNGTSMATPMATGVIALIWASSYGTSNAAVVQRLYDTADKIYGTGSYWTYGRVNAASAVASGTPPTPASTNTPTPTAAQPTLSPTTPSEPTPTAAQPTPPNATPTFYCLGPCPTLPITPTSALPTTTEGPSNQPSPSQSPVPSGAVTPTSTVTPIASISPIQTPTPQKKKGLFQIIRDMILKIIQAILQFILQLLKMFSYRG